METLAVIASVPAIVALVNLFKKVGLPDKAALLLAVALGIVLSVLQFAFSGNGYFEAAAGGLLMGLAAAGVYDLIPREAKVIVNSPEADTTIIELKDTDPLA